MFQRREPKTTVIVEKEWEHYFSGSCGAAPRGLKCYRDIETSKRSYQVSRYGTVNGDEAIEVLAFWIHCWSQELDSVTRTQCRQAADLIGKERAIRDLHDRALNDDDLVLLAVKKAAGEGYSVPMGTVSQKRSAQKVSQSLVADSVPLVPEDKRYYGYFLKTLRRAKSGRHEDAREQAFEMIEELRRWLDEQESQLSQS